MMVSVCGGDLTLTKSKSPEFRIRIGKNPFPTWTTNLDVLLLSVCLRESFFGFLRGDGCYVLIV